MTNRLPITIGHSDDLVSLLNGKFHSVLSKLEAQFNFQTMMANWYGDEDDVISISLLLYSAKEFVTLKNTHQATEEYNNFSDDVFSQASEDNPDNLTCHIAITDVELALLVKQPKIQTPLLNAKLTKVLVLIAQQLDYPQLPS
jgi:hypothetical protein